MPQPRISVVIPVLNAADTLEACLCSVLDQAYPQTELIVVDGGSSDGTRDLIRLYEDQLACWLSQPDEGPACAINRGLRQATGELVCILPADAVLPAGTLAYVARTMCGGAYRLDWLAGCTQVRGHAGSRAQHLEPALPDSLLTFLMHDRGVLPLTGAFFRRELLERVGPIQESLAYAYDYELACRLLAAGAVPAVCTEVLAVRHAPGETGSSVRVLHEGMERIEVARRYSEHLALTDRYALWRNCDKRERIYALAQAEIYHQVARRLLLQKIARKPWWVADHTLRQMLVHGVQHPAPTDRNARAA